MKDLIIDSVVLILSLSDNSYYMSYCYLSL